MVDAIRFTFDILSFISVMVLVVLGLGIIASMMGIFNFAHGEFVLLGAFTMFMVADAGHNAWWGIALAPIVVGGLGLVVERTFIRRFYAAPAGAILGTYAIGLVIRETLRTFLGGQYKSVAEPWPDFVTIKAISFSAWRGFIIAVTIAVIGSCWIFLSKTSTGLKIRGSLENPMLARACGISTARMYALTFAFGSALAGLAGALIVPLYQLSADMGLRFLVQGFLSVMLGGAGTFEGPVLGSIAVGALVAGLPWLTPPVLADPLALLIALLIVKARQHGLLSKGRK